MRLKVCGMREPENIRQLVALQPDFIGMIFYPKSARYVEKQPAADFGDARKVGVFVNATNTEMLQKAQAFGLDLLQLHGEEPVEQLAELRKTDLKLIKVFSVTSELPQDQIRAYEPYVDYFLFDTKTPKYGGSGQKFNWSLLAGYDSNIPFFLSGGIDLEDLASIRQLNLKNLYAIDVNSRFELEPGLKDIEKIKALKEQL